MNIKRMASTVGCLALAGALLTGCAGDDGGSAGGEGGKDTYKVALSMSYSGNDWQNTSRNLIEAAAAGPLGDRISQLDVSVAGTDAQAQIAQLQQMIVSGYDAIVVYPISPTALNPTIKQACEAGIAVFAYDATVSEPCAHNVTVDQEEFGYHGANYLIDLMGDDAENVVMITGVAGTTTDTDRNTGAERAFQEAGINVLDQCSGEWAYGPAGECMSRFLSAFDNIDGVWAQSGGTAITSAFDAANRDLVPIVGEGENAWMLALADEDLKAQGLRGAAATSPQFQGAAALKFAIDKLDGEEFDHIIDVGFGWFTQDDVKICETGSIEELEASCNAFAEGLVSDSFFADWYHPEFTPGMDLQTALTGKMPQ